MSVIFRYYVKDFVLRFIYVTVLHSTPTCYDKPLHSVAVGPADCHFPVFRMVCLYVKSSNYNIIFHAAMSGSNGMFMKLFRYIQGANRSDSMISMTVPVMNEIKDQPRTNNLKMSFYIPNNFQADPPEPNEPSVFIEKKKFTAFVRSFSGYPMFFSQYRKQIDIMLKAMAKDGLEDAYKKNIILYAGYDAPWKMFNRLNEVLLIREEEE